MRKTLSVRTPGYNNIKLDETHTRGVCRSKNIYKNELDAEYKMIIIVSGRFGLDRVQETRIMTVSSKNLINNELEFTPTFWTLLEGYL
jgi:hypothetical protein